MTETAGLTFFRSPLYRVAATVLVFALVGPPLGGLAYMETAALTNIASPDGLSRLLMSFVVGIVGAPMTYYFGIVPALAVGLIVGIRHVFFGPMSWPVVLALGVAAGLAFYVSMGIPMAQARKEPEVVLWSVMAAVVPTLVCWKLTRRWSAPSAACVSTKEMAR